MEHISSRHHLALGTFHVKLAAVGYIIAKILKIDIDTATGVLLNIIVQDWNTGEIPAKLTNDLIIQLGQ